MEPILFQPYISRGEVAIYDGGNLPHWRQDGCTYFVTFRLADSLPQSVLQKLKMEFDDWLLENGITPTKEVSMCELDERTLIAYRRLVAARTNQSLDLGYGDCLLKRKEVAQIVSDAMQFHHGKRVWTGDYVVMPNHVHVLLTPLSDYSLEDVLHSIKGFSAREINSYLGRGGAVWQAESYDHIVRDVEQLLAFQKYIRNNPVKANLQVGEYIRGEAVYTTQG